MTEQKTTKKQQDSWHLVATTGWLAGQSFAINKHAVLGRDADCDITIPGTHLSRRHAEIAVNGDKLLVRDLGSANGTFVNEQPITDAEMQTGDTIRFDVLSFTVRGPNQLLTAEQPLAQASSKPTGQPTANRKAKPSSLGNRDKTVYMTAIQKTSSALPVVAAVIFGLGCIAALGYLLMQL
jgi:pSer/pThr/pTyr-binding forkhead associated (FHA) protein